MSNLLGRFAWWHDIKDGKICRAQGEVVGYSHSADGQELLLFIQPISPRGDDSIRIMHHSKVSVTDKSRKIFEIVT